MLKILLLPFTLIWWLVSFVFRLVGKVLSLIIGLLVVLIGGILTATYIGAILGVPLMLLGVVLCIRAFFP